MTFLVLKNVKKLTKIQKESEKISGFRFRPG